MRPLRGTVRDLIVLMALAIATLGKKSLASEKQRHLWNNDE
jgi:hypothetical protein